VHCIASEAGFDALVVRDRSQLDQLAEMYVLSRLRTLTVVTWRKGIDDPIREWGQLLAYLHQVRQRCQEAGGRAIQLPSPSLTNECYHDPRETLGAESRRRSMSMSQVLAVARSEIRDWLGMTNEPEDRFDELLAHPSADS
jgi:hypothetical protein